MTIEATSFDGRPPRSARSDLLRNLAADLGVAATAAAIISLFAVSPFTLEYFGFSYVTSGGGLLTKVHPSTLLAFTALALRCLASRHPLATARRLADDDPGVALLLLAVAIAACDAAFVAGTPVTGLIDTFVLPVACFLLLRDLHPRLARWLAFAVILLLFANAVMAVVELATQTHFIPVSVPEGVTSDPTRPDAVFDWRAEIAHDWRAIALLGHPLVNGLIVGCFILCLAAPGSQWLPFPLRAGLLLVEGLSMFAFGARASLVFTTVIALALLLQGAIAARRYGARPSPRTLAVIVGACAALALAVPALSQTDFFTRTLGRFTDDAGSAATRLTMFRLFEPFSLSDIVLAPSKDVLATWQRLYGLEFGIESSWIGLILTHGLVVAGLLATGFAAFSLSLLRNSGRGAAAILLAFVLSVSSTASLSGKTTTFAMIVVLVLLMLPREARRRAGDERG